MYLTDKYKNSTVAKGNIECWVSFEVSWLEICKYLLKMLHMRSSTRTRQIPACMKRDNWGKKGDVQRKRGTKIRWADFASLVNSRWLNQVLFSRNMAKTTVTEQSPSRFSRWLENNCYLQCEKMPRRRF